MQLAYLIIAHRLPEQLARLVSRLRSEGVAFFIHADARAGEEYVQRARQLLVHSEDVMFVPRRRCAWGTWSIVDATLRCLSAAVRAGPFGHAVLLSGQDYPIRPCDRIHRHLGEHAGRSFLHHVRFPKPDWRQGGWPRVRNRHYRWGRGLDVSVPRGNPFGWRPADRLWSSLGVRLFRERRFPDGLHPYGGAQFWALTRTHAEYVLGFLSARRDVARFFERVDIPDEMYFATVLANSPHAGELVNDTLTHVEWLRPGLTLDSGDLPALRASHYLFARKFDPAVDADVLDRIDRELLGIARRDEATT